MSVNQELISPIDKFYEWEKNTPDAVFLRQPYGRQWKEITYREAGQLARKLLSAMRGLGLQKGDHVGILSKNCYHWFITDLSIMMGGFVSVPYYASLPKDQLKEVLELSNLKLLFIGKLDSWDDKSEAVPANLPVIRFPHFEGNGKVDIGMDWDVVLKDRQPEQNVLSPALDDLWTILFTSGTTGTPKGVMHNFRAPAIIFREERKSANLNLFKLKEFRFFSFLPLNHVGERIMIEMGTIYTGGTVSFGESLATFAHNLRDVQPTVFFAVPRIWTKFQQGVQEKLKPSLLNTLLAIPVVSGLIRKKIRTAMGLQAVQITLTGAAITPEYLKNWFRKLGINLREVYGMTEACGAISLTRDGDESHHNVGKPMSNFEVKIDKESGEIIYRSEQIMTGYYQAPEQTAEILKDGWLYSGDKGHLDASGNLVITGRVKDAFKTAKGKFVSPAPIEDLLIKNDYIEQVCVVGLGITQPIALVNLTPVGMECDKKTVEQHLQEEIERVNADLAPHERISTIIVHRETWSEHNQMLTPTMKVRRSKIDEKFSRHYNDWHEHDAKVIWN